jgi:hypothetical protein
MELPRELPESGLDLPRDAPGAGTCGSAIAEIASRPLPSAGVTQSQATENRRPRSRRLATSAT